MIYLVRHGQSEWNLRRVTQGQTSHPGLTELGRAQARRAAAAIAAELAGEPVRLLVSSDLRRAVQTARILARVLGTVPEVDRRWREQALGSFEGMSQQQLLTAAAGLDFADPELRVGGGESARQLSERVAAALAELDPAGVSVVVSHGDAIRSALGCLAGLPAAQAPWVEVPNGAVAAVAGPSAVAGRDAVRWLVGAGS